MKKTAQKLRCFCRRNSPVVYITRNKKRRIRISTFTGRFKFFTNLTQEFTLVFDKRNLVKNLP